MDSSADSEGSEQRPDKKARRVKVKRLKTKSEREKYRSHSTKSYKSDQQVTIGSKERSDFRQHIKMAHQTANTIPVTSPKIITQNRLTRRLGLFNQGKASGTIGRGSLLVSESVQAKTELHIRDILESSGIKPKTAKMSLAEPHTSLERLADQCTNSRPSKADEVIVSSSGGSTMKKQLSTSVDTKMDSPKSAPTPAEDLPESPDIGAIAADLLSSLNQYLLLKKDILQEAKDELKGLLRQRNSDPQVTPSTQTYSQITLKGSKSSETVTRTQEDHQTVAKDMVSLGTESGCCHQTGRIAENATLDHRQTASCAACPEHVQSSNIQPETSSQALVLHNDPQYKELMFDMSSQQSMTDLEIQALTDARALLTLNDIITSQDSNQLMNVGPEQSAEKNMGEPFQHNRDNVHTQPFFSMNTVYDHHRMPDLLYQAKDSKHAVAEMLYPPAHISSHCYHIYDLQDNIGDNFHTLYEPSESVEEMDVFDVCDHEIQPHPSSHHNTTVSRCPSRDKLDAGYKLKHRFLQCTSPDSDGSPVWYPTALPVPTKPPSSPSSPPKLYPRRLY